jgi:hypothetical protein
MKMNIRLRIESQYLPHPVTGCWEWLGSKHNLGYARTKIDGRHTYIHRYLYRVYRGEIPAELELDHLCRNRGCVNPYHLEIVSHAENVRRGLAGRANNYYAAKTHCPAGHAYDEANTYLHPHSGRNCRACKRDRERERRRTAKYGTPKAAQN